MTAVTDPDGPLVVARRQLADAVSALADPTPMRHGNGYRWQAGIYDQLRGELAGGRTVRRGVQKRTRLPCRIEVLELLIAIDTTVARWAPDEKGTTVERLRAMTARRYRPQDTAALQRHTEELKRWTLAAAELITPPVRVFLPMPCPRCGARHAYHATSSGDSLRTKALRVSEIGCACLACGSSWAPSEFGFLARLLGCVGLPA